MLPKSRDNDMRLDTRTILIALVIINVMAIGLSEIQRRALVEHTFASQAEFHADAGEWSRQQAEMLKRTSEQLAKIVDRANGVVGPSDDAARISAQLADMAARINRIEIDLASGDAARNTAAQLAEIKARVNKVEIQTLESAAANKRIAEIYDRVMEMQKALQASKPPQPAQ